MILDDIVAAKRADLKTRMPQVPLAELQGRSLFHEPRRSFRAAISGGARSIIAEVKKASPSKGVIRADFDPVWIATRYADCGAAAISVLTEEHYFQGSLDYLAAIRAAVATPLLRKDFLFDPYQLYEARAFGADAVLLIVAMLEDEVLRDLQKLAAELGMAALIEVHDRHELDRAVAAGAAIIGINNRNLRTFETTLKTTETLMPLMPEGVVVVGESGIDGDEAVTRLEASGVHCFLVGESLMRAGDPGVKLAELLGKR